MGSQGLPYGDIWGQGDTIGGYMGSQMSPYKGYMGSQGLPYRDIWGHRVPMGMYGDRDVTIGGHLGTGMLPYGGYMGSQGPYGDIWGQGCHHRGIYGDGATL